MDKVYRATFQGRNIHSGGISTPQNTFVIGADEESARLNLYERFEDILRLNLEKLVVTQIKFCSVDDKIYLVTLDGEKLELVGKTDPEGSFFKVCEEDPHNTIKGYRSCMNMSTGIRSHMNDDLLCVISESKTPA